MSYDMSFEKMQNESNTDLEEVAAKHHVLSEDTIPLYQIHNEKNPPPKPPPTPQDLISDCYVTILPKFPEKLRNIALPCVREVGIRDSIAALAPFFGCEDYKNNLVQFWFLDVLVDVIWRCQDEFRFPNSEQVCVLEWMMFVFKLIGSSNMTKQLMFQVFNEAMTIAEEYIQGGGLDNPIPSNLFSLNLMDDHEQTSIKSFHSSSIIGDAPEINYQPSKQFVIIKRGDDCQVFKLSIKERTLGKCVSSSIELPSEDGIQGEEDNLREECYSDESEDNSVDFWKKLQSKSLKLESSQEENELKLLNSVTNEKEIEGEETGQIIGQWYNIPRKKLSPLCPSKFIIENPAIPSNPKVGSVSDSLDKIKISSQNSGLVDENLAQEEIFRIFYNYNMWLLKNEFMNDSKIGLATSGTNFGSARSISAKKFPKPSSISPDEDLVFIRSCLLMVVRQIVYEYFEHTLPFELARISLSNPQFFITQDINVEWNIPKEIKGDLKKPVPKKPKKEKLKKEPKPKRDKSKSSKGSRTKKTKEKKLKTDKKSSKKSKSTKSDKSKKSIKEDKKEHERLRKENEELEKQLRREAENRVFMFPLKEAVDEKFFTDIFPNYKEKKVKAKGTKSEKSSKGSRESKKTKEKKKKM